MLSRLVITFLVRSKHLLISWLKSPSAVILEPPKIKSLHVSTVSPSICHEVMGPDAMILVFWMVSCKTTFSLSSAPVRSIPFLPFVEPIFSWYVPLVSLIFLKRSLVFPILFFPLCFFALISEEGFLISPCYSLELCIQMGISLLFSFAFHFSYFLSYL